MKILIATPRWFVGDVVNYRYMFPLGLAYISAALKRAGHAVDILNSNHFAGPVNEIVRKFMQGKHYDCMLTGGISTFYGQLKELIEAVKKQDSKIKVILGGGVISSEPDLIFNALRPDYGVIGEGEETIVELLACLARGGDVSLVNGLIFKKPDGKIKITAPRASINDIDTLPYPDFQGFQFEQYLEHMHPSDQLGLDLFDRPRSYPIIGSRSCPYSCSFCFHPIGKHYRQRSLDAIMDELKHNALRYKINIIALYDELFANDRERVLDFCRRMKEFLATLPWECRWGCQLRVDRVDDELLKAMKESGCFNISYGFESYSPQVLKSMKKQITPEQINRAIELTLKHAISIQGNFIFGDLAETAKTAKLTLDYWKEHANAGIILSFINPYPGTQIYQKLIERGVIKDRLDFISNHIFDVINMTEKMSEAEFGRLWFDILRAKLRFRTYARSYRLLNGDNGTVTIRVECPHCRQIIEYGNFYVLSKMVLFAMLYCRACRRRFYVSSRFYRWFTRLSIIMTHLPGSAYVLFRKVWSFVKKRDPRFRKNSLLGRLSDDD